MTCLRTLLRIYGKNPTQKSFKIKSFFGCLKNKRVVVLIHNSTTIYPIDMRLFAPQILFVFACSVKLTQKSSKNCIHNCLHEC
jgi:hypothetical protein